MGRPVCQRPVPVSWKEIEPPRSALDQDPYPRGVLVVDSVHRVDQPQRRRECRGAGLCSGVTGLCTLCIFEVDPLMRNRRAAVSFDTTQAAICLILSPEETRPNDARAVDRRTGGYRRPRARLGERAG